MKSVLTIISAFCFMAYILLCVSMCIVRVLPIRKYRKRNKLDGLWRMREKCVFVLCFIPVMLIGICMIWAKIHKIPEAPPESIWEGISESLSYKLPYILQRKNKNIILQFVDAVANGILSILDTYTKQGILFLMQRIQWLSDWKKIQPLTTYWYFITMQIPVFVTGSMSVFFLVIFFFRRFDMHYFVWFILYVSFAIACLKEFQIGILVTGILVLKACFVRNKMHRCGKLPDYKD